MTVELRDGLSFCLCAERIVFLDLAADRYFCLGADLEASFRLWASGGDPDGRAASLYELGILVPAQSPAPLRTRATPLQATGDLEADLRPQLRDVAEALVAELAAVLRIRVRTPAKVLGRGNDGVRSRCPGPDLANLQAARIGAAFTHSAIVLGSSDRCLARAVAARSMCRRRGVGATLVLGVRLNPFAAHAWVQLGDKVLVGDFEQCRLYTPILAIA